MGSENWLCTELYEYMGKPLVVKKGDVVNGMRILIIDDAIFSGGNIGRSLTDIFKCVNKINVTVIVAITIFNGYSYLHSLHYKYSYNKCFGLSVECGKRNLSVREIFGRTLPIKFINHICMTDHAERHSVTVHKEYQYRIDANKLFEDIGVIWFEHKMPAHNSSASGILEQVVHIEPDRSIIEHNMQKKLNYYQPKNTIILWMLTLFILAPYPKINI